MNPESFEAIYESSQKCQKGVLWKDSVASFSLNALEQSLKLSDSLKDGTYTPRKPCYFYCTHPKKRLIASMSFRDRVAQRSYNDNVLYPQLIKSFIYDNGACQKGKGTDFTRRRFKIMLEKAYRKWGMNFYYLKCDIKGYYPNMEHKEVEKYFREHLDPVSAEQAISHLRTQYPGEKGYCPGSQLLQLAGISMLNPLDHFIKERLGAKFYTRYMDDFILLSNDKTYLESCKTRISKELTKTKMELHPDKTVINPISEGLYFLGFDFSILSGKVKLHLPSSAVKSELKHLNLLKKRGVPNDKLEECLNAWLSFVRKGNNYHIARRISRKLFPPMPY